MESIFTVVCYLYSVHLAFPGSGMEFTEPVTVASQHRGWTVARVQWGPGASGPFMLQVRCSHGGPELEVGRAGELGGT